MRIAEFSVKRPVAVTMRIAGLVLLGLMALSKTPIDLLPNVTIPTVAVITQWPNVAPEQMETQVTRPIEQGVSSVPNLYHVSSSSTLGVSFVRVQFVWGTDIGQAAIDVMQLVQRARLSFPNDPTLQVPIVFKFDPSQLPILIYAVSGMNSIKLRTLLDNQLEPIIESANGVAAATASGGDARSILVNVDPVKLQAYHLTLGDIENRLDQENIDLPSGIAKQGNTEYTIRADGYFTSPQQAASIPLESVGGKLVTLGMVAKVEDSHQETRIFTKLNGNSAVGLTITKQSESNTTSTAAAVKEKIAEIQKEYPQLKFALAYDQSTFITNSINSLRDSALIGGTLAVLILLFFLRSVRSTLVAALSIPVSIISSFVLLYAFGFTINTISLSGMALATGLIVDDAVVVLENIFRHISRDKLPAAQAAVTGASEIMSAVMASTFTVMIVFLPLFMIQGQAGQTFTQFALVVIFALGVSLLDATTVVPMLASRFIKEQEIEEEDHPELRALRGKKTGWVTKVFDGCGASFHRFEDRYKSALAFALKHRWRVLAFAGLATLATLLIAPMIGTELMPPTDSGTFDVTLKLPVGTALAVTDAATNKMIKILRADPDVQTVFSASGSTLSLRGTSTAELNYEGAAIVHLKDNRKSTTQQVMNRLRPKLAAIPGVRPILTAFDIVNAVLSGGPTNMEVDVFGPSETELFALARKVRTTLQQISGLNSVDLGVEASTPELHWIVDRAKAAELGVTFQDIASALDTATNGTLSTYYQENGFQYPIYVQVPDQQRKTISELGNLPITPSAGGPAVLLSQVAKPEIVMGPNEVTRIDQQRYISVTGQTNGRSEGQVEADASTALGKLRFPAGYHWAFGIAQQQRGQEFAGLGVAVFLAIALIYMLLASQFESFIYPLVVLTSVPLSAIGVVLALFLTGRNFGLTAFIGLLMLIGIVVKNGILLVDYTNQLRARGMGCYEAVMLAAPTRLRPILMTASAAILGMLPLALGIGAGSETEAPLATAVIGGLATSTMLTLLVVPVVYTLFDDLAHRQKRRKRGEAVEVSTPPSQPSEERTLVTPIPFAAEEGHNA